MSEEYPITLGEVHDSGFHNCCKKTIKSLEIKNTRSQEVLRKLVSDLNILAGLKMDSLLRDEVIRLMGEASGFLKGEGK